MTEYSYKAVGTDGKEVVGTLDAHSLQAARDALSAMQLDPIEIFETPMHSASPVAPAPSAQKSARSDTPYLPLFETFRLYAGWLLAWYSLVYIIGAYQFSKELPFRVPYAESLFLSPLVLSFTFAAFLFLVLSSLYKALGKRKIIGVLLTLIGIGVFLVYRMNVQ